MTALNKMSVTCKWCGTPLEATYTGTCPKCGKDGKNIVVSSQSIENINTSLELEHQRRYIKTNKNVQTIIITITIISPIFGLIFSGIIGFVVGLSLGILNYILSPLAAMKVLEIKQWRSK